MAEQRKCRRLASVLVDHLEFFATLTDLDAEWAIQNPQDAIALFAKAIEQRLPPKVNAELGDYVTASLMEKTITPDYPGGMHEVRQGVFQKDNQNGTIVVVGEPDSYICSAYGVTVVDDSQVLSETTRQRMFRVRTG